MEGSGMPCMVFNISYDILFYMNMGDLLAICKGFIHCILSKLEGWAFGYMFSLS